MSYPYQQPGYDYNPSVSDVNLHHRHPQHPYAQAEPQPYAPDPRFPPPQQQPPVLGPYDPPRRQRTPSPTPTEIAEINAPLYDYSHLKRKDWWLQWRLVPWYIGGLLLIAGFTMLTLYHKQIVRFLRPAADWMHDLKFGYLIPVAVFFVISFPPLFGHEIVAVICGLVWGLGIGFAITCVGTLLGEIGNYYAFKYCCRARAEKLEKEKAYYDCLARVVREGGFKVALMARLSAIPGHFTTAIFATCGMNIWVFSLAAILSLPKQFITVYAGVMLEQSEDKDKEKKEDKTQKIISDAVAVISVLITFGALWWIYREMQRVKPEVFRDRRRARLAKLNAAAELTSYSLGDSSTRVGTVRFDKYGGSSSNQDLYEMRGRSPAQFAQNQKRAGEDDDGSVESAASDAPLGGGGPPIRMVDYGKPYDTAEEYRPQGQPAPTKLYDAPYDGRGPPLSRPSEDRARGPASSQQQQFYPPMPPPPGAGYARHQQQKQPQQQQQAYPRPPDQYRPPQSPPSQYQQQTQYQPPAGPPQSSQYGQPPRPQQFASPPQSPPQREPSTIPNPFAERSPHAFAPSSPPASHIPALPPPSQSPYTSQPQPGPATAPLVGAPSSAPRFALSDGPGGPSSSPVPAPASQPRYPLSDGPTRQPSRHKREEATTEDGDDDHLDVPPVRGGARHVSEATAYYSASEGEDDDVPNMRAPPPTTSKMPGSLFREESEPGPGWAR